MTMLNVHLPSGRGALIRASAAAIFAALAATALTAVREVRAQTVAVQPEGVITDFIVKYDQSQIFDLSRPAAEIIVGNPIIADVQAQSNTTLIVTGKTFGVTNLIILDAERKKIAEHRIIVTRDNVRTLNLWRSTLRRSYNCVGGEACNPSLVVGEVQRVRSPSQARQRIPLAVVQALAAAVATVVKAQVARPSNAEYGS
jgi:Flp pilus assembly secretin CpaC